MSLRRIIGLTLGFLVIMSSNAQCASLESDWNDFLHYTAIGRFDLAKGYGEAILAEQSRSLKAA